MSYILEALKKSQQERELGHVPTLETSTFPADESIARPNAWILVAVILAVLAVVIALYSALRGGPRAPEAMESLEPTSRPERGPGPADAIALKQEPSSPVAVRRDAPEPVAEEPAAAPATQEPGSAEAEGSVVVMEAPAAAPPPLPSERTPHVAPKRPRAPERRQESKVPDDLIADIEAFKQEVRAAQSNKIDPKEKTEEREKKIAPEDLRLPKELRERLPEFVMSAHIYDKVPSKRFVLINGLKTREGEESREEITVVEILPNGAVLSFEGNRFYQRR